MSYAIMLRLFMLLLLLPSLCIGQSAPTLHLKEVVTSQQQKPILLKCELVNGDSLRTFYKPEAWNFCASLSHVTLKECKSGSQLSYFPCTAVTNLDRVILSAKNTVTLKPHEVFRFTVPLRMSKISPAVKPGKAYTVSLLLNHKYLCGGEKCAAFTGELRSTTSTFTLK